MKGKLLTNEYILKILPKRPTKAHKGTFGKVLIIGGSKYYMGAPFLVASSAYRSGAGLVSLASTGKVCEMVVKKIPEVTLFPLPEDDGVISETALTILGEKLKQLDKEKDVIVVGPGLSTNDPVAGFVIEFFKKSDLPKVIIDGDGLNILSKMENWWEIFAQCGTKAVLTPHPKEFSQLTNLSVEEVQKNREYLAKEFASNKWGQTIILKGANTLISSDKGEVAVAPFANPILATAGTGDVLTGIVAAMMAQGLDQFKAGCVAVYLHGLCGQKLQEEFGLSGAVASDLLTKIPQVMESLKS